MSKLPLPRIVCAVNYVPKFKDPIKQERQKVAMDVLAENKPSNVEIVSFNFVDEAVEEAHLPSCFRIFKMLKRDSKKEIGGKISFPFVKEIADLCSQLRRFDYFCLMNSDILLTKDFFNVFNKDIGAYIFYRTDITKVSVKSFNNKDFRVVWNEHPGNDCFGFQKKWWLKNRQYFHDGLCLGNTEWDTYWRYLIKHLAKNCMIKRSLYHVYHDAKWPLTSEVALNNIAIWNELKEKLGLNV